MKMNFIKSRSVPRWVIQLIDFVIISWSFTLSYFILKHFEFSEIYRGHFFLYTSVYCVITAAVFYGMRIHTGLIRYSNTLDILRIFSAVLIVSIIYPLVVKFIIEDYFNFDSLKVTNVLIINFFISTSLLIMLRTAAKEMFHFAKRIATTTKERVLIYGTNSSSLLIKQAIENSQTDSIAILGFIETNHKKVNGSIEQKRVYHIEDLDKLKNKFQLNKLIIQNDELGSKEKKHIIEYCLKIGIKVVTVPPSDQWVYGRLSLKQIKDLNIEDLLQREPIIINNNSISNELSGKRILITGAAGSIGSEVVRQVLKYDPEMVILCDQAESFLHDMQLEVEEKFPQATCKIFIGNIQNFKRMQVLFREYKPQYVFHAAAYKHVPMMENNPSEAVLTNVMGTKNIADLSVLFEAEKFVMISTDKAVNPTNVMGTSKRIAEMYIQSLNSGDNGFFDFISADDNKLPTAISNTKTRFITTRFGNVLDSNGSVIPRFRSQIQKGGPITVTDPEITRYFMTIPEAVQLVLEAGTMGNGGEIYVFDMGKPVKIAQLAKQMITLAGLIPDEDIKIIYTGLRPGEKLYEELLNEKEKTMPTHHEKIKIAKVVTYPYEKVLHDVEELIFLSSHDDHFMLVKKMKDIVPEFISNNSRFEQLDHIKMVENTYYKSIELKEQESIAMK
jgi:FlaA1/EpsC-like NDP-sugar epimerase